MRTDAADQAFPDVSDLLPHWHAAATLGDLAALAGLASISANRTIALRQADQIPIAALAKATGALGHVIAHTGSARGLIFAPGTVPDPAASALRRAGLHKLVQPGQRNAPISPTTGHPGAFAANQVPIGGALGS